MNMFAWPMAKYHLQIIQQIQGTELANEPMKKILCICYVFSHWFRPCSVVDRKQALVGLLSQIPVIIISYPLKDSDNAVTC